jgi:hypothetical protein
MAVQTSYSINTIRGYAGQVADLQNSEIVSGLVESASIPFGVAVSRGTDDDQVVKGSTDFLGISVRDLARQGALTTAVVQYLQTENASVIRRGTVYAVAPSGATAGQVVKYNTTTGVLGAGTAGGGEVELQGATWETTVGSGAIGVIRLTGQNEVNVGS